MICVTELCHLARQKWQKRRCRNKSLPSPWFSFETLFYGLPERENPNRPSTFLNHSRDCCLVYYKETGAGGHWHCQRMCYEVVHIEREMCGEWLSKMHWIRSPERSVHTERFLNVIRSLQARSGTHNLISRGGAGLSTRMVEGVSWVPSWGHSSLS